MAARAETREDDADPARSGNIADAPQALITGTDVGAMLGLPLLLAVAALVPPRVWFAIARRAAPLAGGYLARRPAALRAVADAFIGSRAAALATEALPRALVASEIARHLFTMRALLPFSGALKTTLMGRAHIDEALGRGRGVVLWDSHFAFASCGTKLALARAGYAVHHLSHPRHGVSDSWVGMHVLNPIWVAAERKFLAERVVLSYASPRAAMATLGHRLRANGVVSVTVRDSARQPYVVPFLDGQLRLAPGAPALARQHGAALIPVFTVADADARIVATAEAPIPLAGGDRRTAERAAAVEYARRLEPYVLSYPGQWAAWPNL